MLDRITPVILTRDEEPNIARTLGQLRWAKEIIILDSLSADATRTICLSYPNVRFIERPFDNHAAQWAFAVTQARTEWVLTLDADYFIPDTAIAEIATLKPSADVGGYESQFRYAVRGKLLRGTLYPPRVILMRREGVSFYMDGHTQRVKIHGIIVGLQERIIHDDRKSFQSFLERQSSYMRREAEKLRSADPSSLNTAGRIRRLRVIAPILIVPYTLFFRGLILDGSAGLIYTFERLVAELVLSKQLIFGPPDGPQPGGKNRPRSERPSRR